MSSVMEPTAADLARQLEDLRNEVAELRERTPLDKAAIIVFSGDLDKLLASLVLATGAAAAGLETTMFFTSGACRPSRRRAPARWAGNRSRRRCSR
jgi:hypothetical protein